MSIRAPVDNIIVESRISLTDTSIQNNKHGITFLTRRNDAFTSAERYLFHRRGHIMNISGLHFAKGVNLSKCMDQFFPSTLLS